MARVEPNPLKRCECGHYTFEHIYADFGPRHYQPAPTVTRYRWYCQRCGCNETNLKLREEAHANQAEPTD